MSEPNQPQESPVPPLPEKPAESATTPQAQSEATGMFEFGRRELTLATNAPADTPGERSAHEQALFELGKLLLNQGSYADAEARFRQSEAIVAEARAGFYPTATINAQAQRTRASGNLGRGLARIDDQRAQVVIEKHSVALILHIGKPRQFGHFIGRTGEKAPMIGVVGKALGVSFQPDGCIELGIEGQEFQLLVVKQDQQQTGPRHARD